MPADASEAEKDPEFAAITAIVRVLEPLDEEARSRVLDYSLRRLGLSVSARTTGTPPPSGGLGATPPFADQIPATVNDIRTLAENKKPKTANEMAALVGYYLAHLAPEADRKAEITAADVTKYFHDANFPLPGTPRMTLVHARGAGYFDAGSAKGSYKLNPVGHNLVAHRLPASASASSTGGRRSTPKRKPRSPKRAVKRAKAKSGSRAGKPR